LAAPETAVAVDTGDEENEGLKMCTLEWFMENSGQYYYDRGYEIHNKCEETEEALKPSEQDQAVIKQCAEKVAAAYAQQKEKGMYGVVQRAVGKICGETTDYESRRIKTTLKAKVALRKVKAMFAEVLSNGSIPERMRECRNQASITVGDIDTDTSPGMLKFGFSGNSPDDFAQLNPPETAKSAAYGDFTIRPGAADADVDLFVKGASEAFKMFVEPMVSMVATQDEEVMAKLKSAGMDGNVYDSFRISKEDGFIRFAIFSGVSLTSIVGDVDIKDMLPHFHQAIYMGWSIGGLFSAGEDESRTVTTTSHNSSHRRVLLDMQWHLMCYPPGSRTSSMPEWSTTSPGTPSCWQEQRLAQILRQLGKSSTTSHRMPKKHSRSNDG
jgi:hypothetical protein